MSVKPMNAPPKTSEVENIPELERKLDDILDQFIGPCDISAEVRAAAKLNMINAVVKMAQACMLLTKSLPTTGAH